MQVAGLGLLKTHNAFDRLKGPAFTFDDSGKL